ncbi:MAG: hypothetical protein JXB46_03350 [Candidatus Eisenbacteria bacterium]|nr:hypothetical protein [Candidatus Eisenbacteria bacterium]
MTTSEHNLSLFAIQEYAAKYQIPTEDVLFTALNFYGLNWDVEFNRMRTAFRLANSPSFATAQNLREWDFYLALPVRSDSPFRMEGDTVLAGSDQVGRTLGASEDYCDSHYQRRLGTCLNINPNTRTSCRGCDFCYTAYQVPLDRQRMTSPADIREFFVLWMEKNGLHDLTHLIQVSVVTGCYGSESHLVQFLTWLRSIMAEWGFQGKVFYLGSTLTSRNALATLGGDGPFGYCLSLECFERRDLLHRLKHSLSLGEIRRIMGDCLDLGIEVNYTYIVGLEPIEFFIPHMIEFMGYTSKFPTINLLQLHQQHDSGLRDQSARSLDYYFEARQQIESLYRDTPLRPQAWEDYRSLWYLSFAGETVDGPRFPDRESLAVMDGLQ